MKTKEEINRITGLILDAAIEVHRNLGPGLLESVYEVCLCLELRKRNLNFLRQVFLPVVYKGETMALDFRIDIIVEGEVIIEMKALECLLPVHEAQILTYLKLADKRVGLLINFNVAKLVDGFKRMVNNFPE